MLYSIAIAVSSLCYPASSVGPYNKDKCQENIITCVMNDSKELDSTEHKERTVLKCYLKWREKNQK